MRNEKKAPPSLQRAAAEAPTPEGRAQSLWILDQMGGLDRTTLLEALNDPVAGVRIQAIRLSAAFLDNQEVQKKIVELAEDENAHVRIQVVYILGESPTALNIFRSRFLKLRL